jgi:hypothetical protein
MHRAPYKRVYPLCLDSCQMSRADAGGAVSAIRCVRAVSSIHYRLALPTYLVRAALPSERPAASARREAVKYLYRLVYLGTRRYFIYGVCSG